jgi:hypothetical protein
LYALGVAAGTAGVFTAWGLFALGGGWSDDPVVAGEWQRSVAVAIIMLAVIGLALLRTGVGKPRLRPPHPATAMLAATGFGTLLALSVSQDVSTVRDSRGLVLLPPLIAAGLAVLPSVVAPGTEWGRVSVAGAGVFLLSSLLATSYALKVAVGWSYVYPPLLAYLALIAALVLGVIVGPRQGPTDLQGRDRSAST